MVIFSIIFGNLAHLPSDGIPYALFSYAVFFPGIYFLAHWHRQVSVWYPTPIYLPKYIFPGWSSLFLLF